MDHKAEFGERLRAAMTHAGYALRSIVLEREFNCRYWGRSATLQAARRWLRGEAIPAQEKLQVLADWLRIEPQVLRFGEHAVLSARAKQKSWEDAVTGPEREVLQAFINLPAPQKKVAREVILALALARVVRVNRPLCPAQAAQHFLYFFPEPQGQGSLRPIFGLARTNVVES